MPSNPFGRELSVALFRKTAHYFLFFLGILLLSSCSKKNQENEIQEPSGPNYKYLVEANLEQSYLPSSIAFIAGLVLGNADQYSYQKVDIYKLTYKTQSPSGEQIEASGAVLIPADQETKKLISYQHGTITNQEHAPSHGIYLGLNEGGLMSLMASTGFVVAMPD